MDWREFSEVSFGLVWEGRRMASMYFPDDFCTPYDEAIRILQGKGGCKEDVAKVIAPKFINNAKDAVKNFNGLGEETTYDIGLTKAAQSYRLAKKFSKAASKLENNEQFDVLPLYGELTSVVSNTASGLQQASTIDYKSYKPFIKSGYKQNDEIIGGVPADGPIIIYGLTGVGKSFQAFLRAICFLVQYPEWTGAIYTLEMSAEHYLQRSIKMYPEAEKVLDRLHVSGSVRNIEELVGEVTSKRVNFVVIDDMDGLVSEQSASEYERVYRKVKEICRFLKIPVIVLAQPNRAAKLSDRFLRPFDISWSGAGENSAALLIALQRTNSMDMQDELFPTTDDELDYMIYWKSRDGWPVLQGPGSVILEPSSKMWTGKYYAGKPRLWSPNSGKQTSIGKKKREQK